MATVGDSLKPERAQPGQKRRRRGPGRRCPVAGFMETIAPDQKGAQPADTSPDQEGTGIRARAGHLRSIPGANSGNRPPERAPAKAVMRRLMLETFTQCRPGIAAALRRRFTNPKTVLECLGSWPGSRGSFPHEAADPFRIRRLDVRACGPPAADLDAW